MYWGEPWCPTFSTCLCPSWLMLLGRHKICYSSHYGNIQDLFSVNRLIIVTGRKYMSPFLDRVAAMHAVFEYLVAAHCNWQLCLMAFWLAQLSIKAIFASWDQKVGSDAEFEFFGFCILYETWRPQHQVEPCSWYRSLSQNCWLPLLCGAIAVCQSDSNKSVSLLPFSIRLFYCKWFDWLITDWVTLSLYTHSWRSLVVLLFYFTILTAILGLFPVHLVSCVVSHTQNMHFCTYNYSNARH